jgi:hypothetical protein
MPRRPNAAKAELLGTFRIPGIPGILGISRAGLRQPAPA